MTATAETGPHQGALDEEIQRILGSRFHEVSHRVSKVAFQASTIRSVKTWHEPAVHLGEFTPMAPPTQLTKDVVVKAVADTFGVSREDILSQQRSPAIVDARHAVAYLIRQQLGESYPKIGEALGGKDHTTAINGIRRATNLLDPNNTRYDPDFYGLMSQVRTRLDLNHHVPASDAEGGPDLLVDVPASVLVTAEGVYVYPHTAAREPAYDYDRRDINTSYLRTYGNQALAALDTLQQQ